MCVLLDNMEKYGTAREATDDNTIQRMRFSCWISKSTDTLLEYVLLVAFPQQKWLRERAPILLYTYNACLVLSGLLSDTVMRTRFLNVLKPSGNFTYHQV
jgi:hypothetical protein